MHTQALNNGLDIPVINFGTYLMDEEEAYSSVLQALEVGYRGIDTAQYYQNEAAVGRAMADSSLAREDIFLTTKVWHSFYGEVETKDAVHRSLDKLQTDYIDLVLLHQPYGDLYAAWRALEDLYHAGTIKSIGVSNMYMDRYMDFIRHHEVRPVVNQLETHVYLQNIDQQRILEENGTLLQAWSPLARGQEEFLDQAELKAIGDSYGKTNAQVILRYLIQRGVNVCVKSVHPDRIQENFDIFDFDLSQDEMAKIKALDEGRHLFGNHRSLETTEHIINNQLDPA